MSYNLWYNHCPRMQLVYAVNRPDLCFLQHVAVGVLLDMHLVKRIDSLHPRIEVELEVLADWSFEREREVYAIPPARPADDPH